MALTVNTGTKNWNHVLKLQELQLKLLKDTVELCYAKSLIIGIPLIRPGKTFCA